MSESETADDVEQNENNDEETEETQETEETEENTDPTAEMEISPDDLDNDILQKLTEHPEIRKYVAYNKTSIPQVASMLNNLQNDEEYEDTFNMMVAGISERSGRITESTIRKVLRNFVVEYEDTKGD